MDNKLRMRFSKTGKAKYISHLDMTAVMRRALLRCGAMLKYSEGFNPHPYISVALPLPIGCGSLCELMDFAVVDAASADIQPEAISAVLPDGLEILEIYRPENKFKDIAWVGLRGALYYDGGRPADIAEKLTARFEAAGIIITKRTKRGTTDIDIAPYIREIEFYEDNGLMMSAKVSAQDPTINADNLLGALDGEYSALLPDFALFTRTEVFDGDMGEFR